MNLGTFFGGLAMDVAVALLRRVLAELGGTDWRTIVVDPVARAYVEGLCDRFDAQVHTKDGLAMRIAAAAFDVAHLFTDGIPTGDDFLRRFATTVGTEIFVPVDVLRDPQRLLPVVAHECEHVYQFRTEGYAFVWLYASEPEARAKYEANAYGGAGLAVEHWLTGRTPEDLGSIGSSLASAYHLRVEDVTLAQDMIASLAASVADGVLTTEAGRVAVAWLEEHAPHLRGAGA